MTPILRASILNSFKAVERSEVFCVQGELPPLLPGLEVTGVGPVALPLTAAHAQELIVVSRQAPFGKGEKTLVDTSVRRTWEIDARQVKLRNPAWDKALEEALGKASKGLGLDKGRLVPHLYKLLLYEDGGFFLEHKDSEKLPGMVASMIVSLPAAHQGGELIVRHGGRASTVDFSAEKGLFQPLWAAFYADCDHEVKPVSGGYRLCLAYNLVLEGAKLKSRQAEGGALAKLRQHLGEWLKIGEPKKLVLGLQYQYTRDSIQMAQLKGADRGRVEALLALAEELDLEVCLGSLCHHENWGAEYSEPSRYSRSRYSRSRWQDEEDEEDDEDDYNEEDEDEAPALKKGAVKTKTAELEKVSAEDFDDSACKYEVNDLYDDDIGLENLCGLRSPWKLSSMDIEDDELLLQGALKGVRPEESYEGYTGNAGETVDRWYRHAVAVVWPKQQHYRILCDQELDSAWLAFCKDLKSGQLSQSTAVPVARQLLDYWLQKAPRCSWREGLESCQNAFPALLALGDSDVLRLYITSILPKAADEKPDFSKLPRKLLAGLTEDLKALFLSQRAPKNASVEAKRMFGSSDTVNRDFDIIAAAWKQLRDPQLLFWAYEQARPGRDGLNSLSAFRLILGGAVEFEQPDLLRSCLDWLPELRLTLQDSRIDIATELLQQCVGKVSLLPLARDHLAAVIAEMAPLRREPIPYPDQCRPANYDCGASCAPCNQMRKFLAHPALSSERFAYPQAERKHLISIADDKKLDVKIDIDRSKSPHSLIVTKIDASHQRAVKRWKNNLEQIARLEKLLAKAH